MTTKNRQPLILRAIQNESVERPPVWIMRQAGRYLQEYRELKQQHGFLGLCRSPELATEVSMQPVRYLNVDAAIIFSDILIPMQCLGINVDFAPGPQIANPIRNSDDITKLKLTDPHSTVGFVFDAIATLRAELTKHTETQKQDPKAVIGFAGAPWTLACYIIDQGPFKHFQFTQVMANQNPTAIHALLEKITDVVTDYVLLQIDSGADIIQLFDTWGGNLSESDYKTFSLPYLQKIITAIHSKQTPCTVYANGSSHLLSAMKESGADCLSIDWRTSLSEARQILGEDIVLQGNFDSTHLFRTKSEIVEGTRNMIKSISGNSGYIANLGHGILVETPRENALAFVDSVRSGWATN